MSDHVNPASVFCGLLVLTLATSLRAQNQEVVVGVRGAEIAPVDIVMQAEMTASRIYARIGVKLKWSNGSDPDIRVQVDTGVAAELHAGALGYAAPYARRKTVVHVLFDRVSDVSTRGRTGVLLGHVIAHELGHILKGTDGHADCGIMKAQWDAKDLARMTIRPLSFTRVDAELIREGVAHRRSSLVADAHSADKGVQGLARDVFQDDEVMPVVANGADNVRVVQIGNRPAS
jgi:hypothetical protein